MFRTGITETSVRQMTCLRMEEESICIGKLHLLCCHCEIVCIECMADTSLDSLTRPHRSYVVGLCWVMKYYYDGCASWKWYYPFHYGPFASDLKNIERFQKDCDSFELHEPFKPVEQLMGVLPEDSAHAIPKASRWLMCDQESPIIDFYPKEVPVDPNGKAMPWLWVVLLPFIDEERLLAAM